MVKRGFRLVKKKKINNYLKYKKNKYLYIYSISLIRFFPTLISKIKIQNYYNKVESTVDYLVNLKEEKIQMFLMLLNKNLTYNYDQLLNITCVDNLTFSNTETNSKFRFTLIYILNNINLTSRLTILFSFSEETVIRSISKIYKASLWLEREIYDLFGIFFFEHPDLRRILTDYGFKGFPLRKDFPLTGYVELRFSEELKSVKYQPIKLIQEYRYFDFESPWKLNDSNLMKNYEKF